MAEACKNSRINIIKLRGAMLRFVLHIGVSQLYLVDAIAHCFLYISLFAIDRCEFCHDSVKRDFSVSRNLIIHFWSISVIAIGNIKRTLLNEWWRPLIGMCQSK
jgi:hypothetical protein